MLYTARVVQVDRDLGGSPSFPAHTHTLSLLASTHTHTLSLQPTQPPVPQYHFVPQLPGAATDLLFGERPAGRK